MHLVDLIKTLAVRKRTTPAQIRCARLANGTETMDRADSGTTVMQHMVENSGADGCSLHTILNISELNSAVRAIEVKGPASAGLSACLLRR
jgi:hypothetical protein